MIKITNKQVIDTLNVFDAMKKKTIPWKLSFAIGKNMEALHSGIYKPYLGVLEDMRKKYMELDEDGQPKKDKNGLPVFTNLKEYEKELQELFDVENDFEAHLIAEELLDQCEADDKYDKLSTEEIIALMKFIKG